MIGYVLVDGGYGAKDILNTSLRSNGTLMLFTTESAAWQFVNSLEEYWGLEVKDLTTQKVEIKPIFEEDA